MVADASTEQPTHAQKPVSSALRLRGLSFT